MKIVCFFNATKEWGGGERSHLEYALEFKKRNYKVSILARQSSELHKKAKENNIEVKTMNFTNLSFLNPSIAIELHTFFKLKKIDTIFFNSSTELKNGTIPAKLAGIKNIVYMRGLAYPAKNDFLNKFLLKKGITHLVSNSKDTQKVFLKDIKGINQDKVHIIYRGINFNRWYSTPLKKINAPSKSKYIIGNVGRLEKQKGQNYLLDIAEYLRSKNLNFEIRIAGSGPLESKLQNQIIDRKLSDNIKLVGFTSNVRQFLQEIDVFIFPSLWEGFGYAAVEAMAEAIPVIAFNKTSNPEIIESGKTGFLVNFPDTQSMAEKIIELYLNKSLAKEIGENARYSVNKRFNFDTIIEQWKTLLN